jgi:spermidine synthase
MKLKAVVFICGAVVMALELLGSRVIAPFYGNSLFAWGSLIGVILGALSAGYYYGGRAADKDPTFYSLSMIILKAGFFVAVIPLLSQLILVPEFVYLLGMKYGPLVSVTLLFAVPSVLLGMVSPYSVKLAAKNIAGIGNVAGDLYAISTLGSIFGTFATAFFLIPEVGVKSIIYLLSVTLILTAFACSGKRIIPQAAFGLAVFGVCAFSVSSHSYPAEGEKIVFQKDTSYYGIKIVDYPNSTRRAMFLDGSYTGAQYTDSNKAVYAYTDYFHLPFIINPNITSVLFLGGGAGTGPKRFHESYKGVNIDVVEIDPAVNEAAVKYFNLSEDERLALHADEGRSFLAYSPKKYDLIVLDVFNSIHSVPYHLMTLEFLNNMKEHLTHNGCVILNMHASIEGPKSGLFNAEVLTYKKAFPNVYVFPVGQTLQEAQNIMILASKSDRTYSREEFIAGARALSGRNGITEMEDYAGKYITPKITSGAPILTDDYAPVDSLILPLSER